MRSRAVLLVCVAALFALTPLMLPEFNGYDPKDFWVNVADPAAQPPRITFLIWFVIFPGLIAHALLGLVSHAEDRAWDANRVMLIASLLLGIAWAAFAPHLPIFASGIMVVMAVAALYALFRTGKGSFWQQPPVALFAGWVTAAAGVAWGVTLAGLGALSNVASAYVMLCAVLIVAICVQRYLGRVPAYAASIVWALIGIAAGNWGVNPELVQAALIGAGIMAVTPYLPA